MDEKNVVGDTLKYKIAVLGAAETENCGEESLHKAEEFGRLIAEKGMVLVTGVTTGTPYWAAKGAKAAGGIVIGFSPAPSRKSHVEDYKLPLDYHDLIVYTGLDYSGRNLLIVRSADALFVVCGRMGTLNAFTTAFEDKKPIGVLTGTGGVADALPDVVQKAGRGEQHVIFGDVPKDLFAKVTAKLPKETQ